jgi:hypothetical protein
MLHHVIVRKSATHFNGWLICFGVINPYLTEVSNAEIKILDFNNYHVVIFLCLASKSMGRRFTKD